MKNNEILKELILLKDIFLNNRFFTWNIKKIYNKHLDRFNNIEVKVFSLSRTKLISQGNPYIIIKNDNIDHIIKQFIDKIQQKDLSTINKVFKILYIISILDTYNHLHMKVIDLFLKKLSIKKIESLIFRVIKELNNTEWIIEAKNDDQKNFIALNKMYRKFMHINIYDTNPGKILIDLLYISKYSNIVKVFQKLSMFSILLIMKFVKYEDLLFNDINYLKESIMSNCIPSYLIVFIISKMNPDKFSKIPKDFLKWLCENYWDKAGKYISRLCFGYTNRNSNTGYELFEDVIHEIYSKWVITNHNFKFIESFEWPNDFESFSGWLLYIKDLKKDIKFELNDDFYNMLSCKLLNICKNKISLKVDFFRFSKNKKIMMNILHPKSNIVLRLISYSIFNSENNLKNEWLKIIKKYLFYLKPFYYSNSSIINDAINYSSTILVVLLSICAFKGNKFSKNIEKNIKTYVDLIIKTILFPYVKHNEFDVLVWRFSFNEDCPGKLEDEFLWLIIKYLIMIKKNNYYTSLFSNLLKKWEDFSTTTWPWMK